MTDNAAAVVARLLLPDDANPAGNVHGGTTLKMMEEAGMITATRHVGAVTALVRFENMSFHKPVLVGQVASVSARVIFTSKRSVLVKVVVTAEDAIKGKKQITNSGELWHVALTDEEDSKWKKPTTIAVPEYKPDTNNKVAMDEYDRAKKAYESRKKLQEEPAGDDDSDDSCRSFCLEKEGCLCPNCRASYTAPENAIRTPAESQQSLSQVVLPGDCHSSSVAFGGFVMKLMDNAAGCSAFRHCRTNVVTVAISAMDFVHWVHLGEICTIQSRVVFCSNKTLEIEVVASTVSMHSIDNEDDVIVAKGKFVFASLDSHGKAIAVPPLKLETKEDFEKAYSAQQRYEQAKMARMKASSKK